jgi:uncharacterized protein (DUF983 family)
VGPVFKGYLTFAERCTACGADFRMADAGDGPAVFVMFCVGAVVVPLAFVLEFAFHWPAWATVAVCGAAAIALSLALLRPFKAVLFALQWKFKAQEGRPAP